MFGLPAAKVVAWLGDNSSSLVGVGLAEEGDVAISLGTSDTIFGVMTQPRVSPDGIGHVFASPSGGAQSESLVARTEFAFAQTVATMGDLIKAGTDQSDAGSPQQLPSFFEMSQGTPEPSTNTCGSIDPPSRERHMIGAA